MGMYSCYYVYDVCETYTKKLSHRKSWSNLLVQNAFNSKGTPLTLFIPQAALRQITDKAREFGAGPLFNQILPLLMSPTLEDQERHLLVKVIDRILYKLDDLVRPYVHKVGCFPQIVLLLVEYFIT